jgi:hypothetical protein
MKTGIESTSTASTPLPSHSPPMLSDKAIDWSSTCIFPTVGIISSTISLGFTISIFSAAAG